MSAAASKRLIQRCYDAFYSWKDIGEAQESEKPMQFWMRRL